MQDRGRTLKFTAALVISALALTGFTTGRGHGGHGRHSGGGGGSGCSSSQQDHDNSSSTTGGGSYGSGSSGSTTSGSGYDDDDDSYGSSTSGGTYNRRPTHRSTASSSSSGGSRQLKDAKAKLVSCATRKAPYATVEVTNSNGRTARFWVSVTFVDADDITVTMESKEVEVPARGKATARLEVGGESLVDSVDHCDTEPYASPVSD
jgi:hypothetical protein